MNDTNYGECMACGADGEVTTHDELAAQPETVLETVHFLLPHFGGIYCPECCIPYSNQLEGYP
jgi:hypothetical protein